MKRNGMLFLFGCCAYPTLEVLWRGYTHASMSLAGGMCMVLINKICCEKLGNKPLSLRCAAGSLLITAVDFLTVPACAVCRVCVRLAGPSKSGDILLKDRKDTDLLRGL